MTGQEGTVEQKGGAASENNDGAPEAACAPKAAAALPMPRHRRSKRSVSSLHTCCPRLRLFHIWTSKLRSVLNFAAVSIRVSVHLPTGTRRHASMDRRVAPWSNASAKHSLPWSLPARPRFVVDYSTLHRTHNGRICGFLITDRLYL